MSFTTPMARTSSGKARVSEGAGEAAAVGSALLPPSDGTGTGEPAGTDELRLRRRPAATRIKPIVRATINTGSQRDAENGALFPLASPSAVGLTATPQASQYSPPPVSPPQFAHFVMTIYTPFVNSFSLVRIPPTAPRGGVCRVLTRVGATVDPHVLWCRPGVPRSGLTGGLTTRFHLSNRRLSGLVSWAFLVVKSRTGVVREMPLARMRRVVWQTVRAASMPTG